MHLRSKLRSPRVRTLSLGPEVLPQQSKRRGHSPYRKPPHGALSVVDLQ